MQAFGDIAHQVDADQVIQTEDTRFRYAQGPAEDCVRFFWCELHAKCRVQRHLNGIDTHSIAKKSGRVVADDNSFP